MLGELRTICLDKYIQTSVRPCRTGRLAQGTCVTISRIPQGQRLLSLDLSTRFVHNYKDTPGPASAEMPDGKRFTPACAPPAGPGGSGRRSPTSPDGGGPTFPRQRVLRPERPSPGQIRDAAQRGEGWARGGGGGRSLWVVSAGLLCDAGSVRPRGPSRAVAPQARTEAPAQTHGGKPRRPRTGRARGRTYAKRRRVGRAAGRTLRHQRPSPQHPATTASVFEAAGKKLR